MDSMCKVIVVILTAPIIFGTASIIPTTLVNAQVDGNMDCAEMRGAKAISAFLDGTFMGLEGDVADPEAQKVLNALTQGLLELQQQYNSNC
jgi:hypothetical protein